MIAGCAFVLGTAGTIGCAEDPPIDQSHEAIGANVMLGNTNVEAADDNAAGYAYAFKYTAAQTGTVDGLKLYVGAGNQAQTIQIGLYGDSGTNHPGALLTSGTLSQPTASAWNQAAVTAAQVTQGKTYWIAILSPAGGGAIHLRARGGATGNNETAAGSFASLPGTWVQGTQWSGAAMSAVALGSTTTPPPPPPTGQTLVGNAAVASAPDDTGGGEAYAFKYTAAKSGKVDTLRLYVDTGNAAQTLQLGLYTNNNGHPGTKLTGGTITNPTPNQWNPVAVPTVNVAAGGTYWIALLSPAGGGRPRIRAEGGATGMNESASGSFSALPATWVNGSQWSGKNLSATADGLVSDGGTTNACGGTVALPHEPGESCSSTAGCAGTYVCSGKDAVVCNAPQSCGGAAGRAIHLTGEAIGQKVGKCTNVVKARDGGGAFAGGGMIECNWDGVRKQADWSDPLADITFDLYPQPGNEYLLRFKQRIDQDFDVTQHGAKFMRIGGNNLFQLDGDSVHYTWCEQPSCAGTYYYNFWSTPMANRLKSRQWHEWEIYVRGGSNGAIKVWVDGQLATNNNGGIANYAGPVNMANTLPIHIGSNWSDNNNPQWRHDANNHRYIDELELYTAAAGASSSAMAAGTIGQ